MISPMVIGRFHALGRMLGPARTTGGNGRSKETRSWHSTCLQVKAERSWEDRGELTLSEGEESSPVSLTFCNVQTFPLALSFDFYSFPVSLRFYYHHFSRREREEVSCSRPHIRKQAGTTSQAPDPIRSLGQSTPVPLAPQLALSSLLSQDSLILFSDNMSPSFPEPTSHGEA